MTPPKLLRTTARHATVCFAVFTLLSLLASAPAHGASLSVVGSPQVIGTSTDAIGIAWRSAAVTKNNDADGDNILGSLGYWLAKTNTSPNQSSGGFNTAQMTFSAPSWLGVAPAIAAVGTSINYGYRGFQNPTAPAGKITVGYMGRHYSGTLAAGTTYSLYRFTVGSGAPSEFRITVATHSEFTAPSALQLAQVAGTGSDSVLVSSLPASGSTGAVFTTFKITSAQAGDVFELGGRTSHTDALMVNAFMIDGGPPAVTAPAITGQPSSLAVTAGSSASFAVTATGTNLSYQWRKGNDDIPLATGPTYTIPRTTANDANGYACLVSNSAGSVLSAIASLTVNPAPPAPDGSTQWKNIDLRGMGFVTGILAHPTTGEIYTRTDVAGIFRWDAPASRWVALLDDFGNQIPETRNVESFALDPGNPNRLFAAYGPYVEDGASISLEDGILRSDNKGLTWTRMNLPSSVEMGGNSEWRHCGERLAVDPANSDIVYFGSRQDGLWRSTDGGLNWTQIAGVPVGGNNGATRNNLPVNGGITFVVIDPAATTTSPLRSATVYLGIMGAGVYRSTDGGNTFALLGTPPAADASPIQGRLASDRTLYVTLDEGVWRWRANAWTSITPPVSGFTYSVRPWAGLAVDPADPNRLAINATGTSPRDLFVSTDGGATWIIHTTDPASAFPVGRHKAVTFTLQPWIAEANQRFSWSGAITFAPGDSNQIWLTTGFGVYVYKNLTANPVVADTYNHMAGLEELVGTRVLPLPSGGVLAGVMDQGGFVIRDPAITPAAHLGTAAIANSTGLGISAQTNTIAVSLASGGYSEGEALASDDGGQTWRTLAKPFAANPSSGSGMTLGGDIAVSATDKNNFVWIPLDTSWYPNDHPPIYSTNGGASWTPATGLPTGFNGVSNPYFGATNILVADTVNGSVFYAYHENTSTGIGTLYRSTNGGANWSARANNLPGYWRSILQARPGTEGELWYSTTTSILLRSTDGGATFVSNPGWTTIQAFGFGAPLPGETKNTIYAVGTRGGIFAVYYSVNDGATWQRPAGLGPIPLNITASISGDFARPGRIYIASGGRGLFYVDLIGSTFPANTGPTIGEVSSPTIPANSTSTALAFTIGDAETSPTELTLSATSSNSTLIPAGNIVFGGSGANRTVTVTPTSNQTGTATITVTVSDGTLTAQTSFSVTVAPNFSSWLSGYPGVGGQSAPGDDPDGDGLTNLLEYAIGSSPTSSDPTQAPLLTIDADRLRLTFLRARTDITYEVLASSTLAPATWAIIATNPGTVGQAVTVTDTLPISETPQRFLRLRATLNP